MANRKKSVAVNLDQFEVKPAEYTSFFVLKENNPLRVKCRNFAQSKCFEYIILAAIIFNCILMSINSQLPSNDMSKINILVEEIETYLLGLFTFEMCINIVHLGFCLHPGSYLRNPWNMLDFVVVVTGIMGLPQLKVIEGGGTKALKALRVLRPLKLVSGVPSLQVVMTSIAKSMIPLSSVCVLVAFVVILFAVVGLQLLIGQFHFTCYNIKTGDPIVDVTGEDNYLCHNKSGRQCPDGYICDRYWSGPNEGMTSFDNIFIGMLTVFVCITCEGWTDTMYWTFDVADVHRIGFWIYYYVLNVIGAQFMLNLVLGVLSGEFGKEGERLKWKEEFMASKNEAQAEVAEEAYSEWVDKGEEVKIEEQIESAKPEEEMTQEEKDQMAENKATLRKLKMKALIRKPAFFWVVMTCVFLNAITTSTQHYGQSKFFDWLQQGCSLTFMGVFTIELIIKLYALGPRGYFKSQFNTFDAVVVVCGLGEIILRYTVGITLGISVLRALKLLKLFKFTRYWQSLKNLIGALMGSIGAIMSLMLLLVLFLMIFSLLGMTLFGGKFQGRDPVPRTNFDDFWNAFLAVFQILTGEDWNFVMYEGKKILQTKIRYSFKF